MPAKPSTTAIKERPILFSAPMVRAILDGRKTQTRRVAKPQPNPEHWQNIVCDWYEPIVVRHGMQEPGAPVYGFASEDEGWKCKYGAPGDRLWVRETWLELRHGHWHDTGPRDALITRYGSPRRNAIAYKAECTSDDSNRCRIELGYTKWKPSIFMPRWASRITLEITGVRVERLQDISESDATAEGVGAVSMADAPRQAVWSHRQDFAQLWDTINGKPEYRWKDNPWVWALTFKRLEPA